VVYRVENEGFLFFGERECSFYCSHVKGSFHRNMLPHHETLYKELHPTGRAGGFSFFHKKYSSLPGRMLKIC
jgi:hypothetical protein